MIDHTTLQRALDEWPDAAAVETLRSDAPRLASALQQAASGDCGAGDISGLVRAAIREWQESHGRRLAAPLRVPSGPPWPRAEDWVDSGIHTAPGADAHHLRIVDVEPWQPSWHDSGEPLDAFPCGREKRRHDERVAADPIWSASTGFDSYRSLEQREAVRTLLASTDDDTVLVLLPTGSGKSLVGLLHALATGPGAVSIVVVPTTSLALDQEEQLRTRLRALDAPDAEENFAFHGGLSRVSRGEILTRVRTGGQRVVFASPESLFGALGDALVDAASAGRLGQFVVDEAHIVATWGAEFRPEFQAIAGFRRTLLTAASVHGYRFRTVLMTATATASDVATLADLFTESGRRLVAAGAVALRPEIAYVAAEAPTADERVVRVEDAVRHLPRPLFLYATRPVDVAALAARVRALGIRRVVTVTGDSNDSERRHAIRALRGVNETLPEADIAIGTSAFGLGIDIEGVRCVVHSCLPESVDRYYQEVGRSGRDGCAALGLLLWTSDDQSVAESLSTKRIIGVPLARQRWSAMLKTARLEEGIEWVDAEVLRIGLFEESSENEKWNSRTLASMARTGLIRLVGFRRSDDGRTAIGVQLVRHDLAAEPPWTRFEAMRMRSRRASETSLQMVLEIARGGGVCDALEELYSVQDPERLTADLVAHHTCGGCPGCAPPRLVPTPPLPIPTRRRSVVDGRLHRLAGEKGVVLALQPPTPNWARSYASLIQPASAAGVHHLICTETVLRAREVARALRQVVASERMTAPLTTVLGCDPEDDLAYLTDDPTLLLLSPHDDRADAFSVLQFLPRPVFAVVPESHPAQERTDMTLKQMYPGAMTTRELEDLLTTCQT